MVRERSDMVEVPDTLIEGLSWEIDRLMGGNFVEAANAATAMSDFISDLKSWHPRFNADTGYIDEEFPVS